MGRCGLGGGGGGEAEGVCVCVCVGGVIVLQATTCCSLPDRRDVLAQRRALRGHRGQQTGSFPWDRNVCGPGWVTLGTVTRSIGGRGKGEEGDGGGGGGRERDRFIERDRQRGGGSLRENSNSKTLFSKDCSLGSVRPV